MLVYAKALGSTSLKHTLLREHDKLSYSQMENKMCFQIAIATSMESTHRSCFWWLDATGNDTFV